MTENSHSSLELYFSNYQRTRAFHFETAGKRAERAENLERLRVRWDVAEVGQTRAFQVDGDGASGSVLFVLAVAAVGTRRRVAASADAQLGAASGDSGGERGVRVAGAARQDGTLGGPRHRAAAADVSVRLGGVCEGVFDLCAVAAGR